MDNPISALPLFDIFNNPFAFTNFLLCWHFMIIIGSAILLLFSISICDQSFSMRGGSLTLVNKFGYRDASYTLLWCSHANKNSWVSEYKTGLKFTSQYFIYRYGIECTCIHCKLVFGQTMKLMVPHFVGKKSCLNVFVAYYEPAHVHTSNQLPPINPYRSVHICNWKHINKRRGREQQKKRQGSVCHLKKEIIFHFHVLLLSDLV